ncbi:GBS Bsp-like repeat-containing protein [Streptococcus marimammalium]|uniref:GBS Bsp-like repeat-containing protein n=1 Tax=Streptococcus marimammalium TaxID=269666 RepID=UPI00037AABF0|nr:GBS Bsp-like repeat-containing protein [Streptococcus marimammalium]
MKKILHRLLSYTMLFLISMLIIYRVEATDVAESEVTIKNFNQYEGTFDVIANEAENSKTISYIDIAVWSEKDWQDDLKWYSTDKVSNNSIQYHFNIKEHGGKSGNYIVHAYITYNNGSKKGFDLGKKSIKLSKPELTTTGEGIKIKSKIVPEEGRLVTAVWSEENGQDDLKWYYSNSDGIALAKYMYHKSYGKYNIHTYLQKPGEMKGISIQTLQIEKPNLNYQITKVKDTAYQVTINDVPEHMTSILVPIWSDKNGQDDLKWYQATKIDATTYQVMVPLKNHHFNLGHYSVHLYGRSDLYTGLKGLQSTSGFSVDAITSYDSPQMGSSMTNSNQFSVTVNETEHSKVIKSINVAVWSDANQGNLKWYQSQHSNNGSFSINADIKNHANKSGLYHVHVYITYNDGETRGYPLSQVSLSARIETSYTYFSQYYMPSNYQNVLTYKAPTSRTIYGGYDNIGTSYSQGQCTFYVYNRIRETHGISVYRWLGNGQDWVNSLTSQGWHRSNQPSVGAVLSVKGGYDYTLSQYGHVAFVEHVNSDGSFLISELNYNEIQTKVHWRVLRPQFYYSFASYQ